MKQYLLIISIFFTAFTLLTAQSTTSSITFISSDFCSIATNIDSLLGGEIDIIQNSGIYDNTNATVGEEPVNGFECFRDTEDGPVLENTQWFSFIGDGNTYEIRTSDCGAASPMGDNDSQIAVYSGADCDNLNPVTCNEDEDGSVPIFSALVTVPTEAGTTYYVMIDGWNGTVGEYCITVTQIRSLTCPNLLVANPTIENELVCLGDTFSIILDGEVIVPTAEEGLSAFRFLIHSEDISNTENPFAEASYLNSFGPTSEGYNVTSINDVTALGLTPGTYYFTPVVYGGGVSDTTGNPTTYTFENGCVSVGQSLAVILLPEAAEFTATATATPEDEVQGTGGTATVTTIGTSGEPTYLWSNGDTTQTITDLSAGEYFVTVTDPSSCAADVVAMVVVDFVSSLNNPALSAAVQLYPNPATDAAIFQYSLQTATDLTINVINTLGQTVISQRVNNATTGTQNIDLSNLTAGTYFVRYTDGKRQAVKQLVVLR